MSNLFPISHGLLFFCFDHILFNYVYCIGVFYEEIRVNMRHSPGKHRYPGTCGAYNQCLMEPRSLLICMLIGNKCVM